MNFLDIIQGVVPTVSGAVAAGREADAERQATEQAALLAAADRAQARLREKRQAELDAARLDEIRARTSTIGKPTGTAAFEFAPIGGTSILNRRTGEVTPIAGEAADAAVPRRGTPEYVEYERQLAQARAQGAAAGRPAPQGDRVAASTRVQLAEGAAQLDLIRQAREAVTNRPQSFGLSRGAGLLPGMGQIGSQINQRVDPEGTAARQLVAQVSAMKIKDLSGAAVTVSEFPRLAAFVPLEWDRPEKILANLAQLERELLIVQQALANGVTLDELMGSQPTRPRGGTPRPASPTGQPSAPPDFEAWRQSRRGNP